MSAGGGEPDRAIARLEAALADAGAEHAPPAGWEARVLARARRQDAPPRARWWMIAAPALAAAAAIAIFVAWPRSSGAPSPQPLTLALALERGGPVVRGTSAHVGDTVHATARGGGAHRAIWIYRDDRALALACPGGAACRTLDGALVADLAVTARGDYSIVALTADAPLPTPTGSLDGDVAAAARAGATFTIEPLAVR